ncbi:MoaD/ThiS family protein [Saccharicrinis aurantiacus]|uniref:MoaD/ThiS family protein n=1 Tax=Saccharicrinis aurantiacus TaxID=1849719 RepID=UPI0009F852C8|nr:MoaD/ThiS family protein [Saccharicrinis aurantiacus]
MIKVHFFAALKQYFTDSISVEFIENETVTDFIQRLAQFYPDAAEPLTKCRVAINEEFVSFSDTIQSQTEVYVIPPSSGG